jgi:transcriptional regulator with XRE-family HTH domain
MDLEQKLGEAVKRLRLQKNLPREELCSRAGVSLTALRNLESGSGASVRTLVQIARALGKQDWLLAIAPQVTINPLHMLKEGAERQRARTVRTRL